MKNRYVVILVIISIALFCYGIYSATHVLVDQNNSNPSPKPTNSGKPPKPTVAPSHINLGGEDEEDNLED